MFVAPGTGVILEWVVKGIEYGVSIKEIWKSASEGRKKFLKVYANDILRANLLESILKKVKEIPWVETNFNTVVDLPVGADLDTKIKH